MRSLRLPGRLGGVLLIAQSPRPLVFPHSSLVIPVLGRIIIGRSQLASGGLLGEPAQLDDARPDMMSRANLAAARRTASPSWRGGFGVGAVIR
jgi:hypothetical protein